MIAKAGETRGSRTTLSGEWDLSLWVIAEIAGLGHRTGICTACMHMLKPSANSNNSVHRCAHCHIKHTLDRIYHTIFAFCTRCSNVNEDIN